VLGKFLGGDRQTLLDYALSEERNFRAATVSLGTTRTVVEGVRRAKILDTLGEFEAPFRERLRMNLDGVASGLGYVGFTAASIEAQITASNDGDYFRLHQDSGPDSTREITFVYFLHGEPHAFSGGELRVRSATVAPLGDTIVFFPSGEVHEVLPVCVPGRSFRDSRFTVNGWIHRKR